MFFKKINKILIIIIFLILLSIGFIVFKKNKIINYESDFYQNLNSLINHKNTKKYNFETINSVNDNDVIVINISDINDRSFVNNLNISRYISDKFYNVAIYNIIVEDNNKANDNFLKFTNNYSDEIIYKYNIYEPTIYVDKNAIDETKFLSNSINKLIILDKVYNVIKIYNNDIGIDKIFENINEVASKKVKFNKSSTINANKTKKQQFKDYFLYKNMSKIILLKNFKGKNSQIFAILDTSTKNIILINSSGEIKYIIDCNSFCSPSNIKYIDDKLYVLDSCVGSIEYYDFEEKKLRVFAKNNNLIGINDFEFINNNYILISKIKSNNDSIDIFSNNIYTSLVDLSEQNKDLKAIPTINKYKDKYYYFDDSKKIMYSFDGSKSEVVLKLDKKFSDKTIKSFYINSNNDIYFIPENSEHIIHYHNGNVSEKSIGDNLISINDILINKNTLLKLSDNYLEIIENDKRKKPQKIKPFISKDTENFGNLLEQVDINDNYNFCNFNENTNSFIYDILKLEKEYILEPSFIMLFSDNYNGNLILNSIYNYIDIYKNKKLKSNLKYIFGKIYFVDYFGDIRIRRIGCKIK